MLIMISESFVHALLLCLGLFLEISRWVPLAIVVNTIFQRIYKKIELSSQRKELFLFLATNMAGTTSLANQ